MEKYSPEWFQEKANSEEYADVDKKAEEARQKFLERFSPEKLEELDGIELLNTIFLSPTSQKDYLCYFIEFDPQLKKFGGIGGGSVYSKFDLSYSADDQNWKCGSSIISEKEAIEKATDIRNKLVAGAKAIQEFINEKREPNALNDYRELNDILENATRRRNEKGGLVNRKSWFLKYYAILYKNLFAPFYNHDLQKEVLKAINKEIPNEKSRLVCMGQICLYAKECGISPVLFHQIYNDNPSYSSRYADQLLKSKNLIFHGAPGTGKTYLAKQIAADIISGGKTDNFDSLTDEQKKQMGFVQFHPGYDYSDFVEGLRPCVNDADGTMRFELRAGIFKAFVDRAREDKDKDNKNKYVFIIDEINRGEISKIFGELFFSIDPNYRGETGAVTTQYANLHKDPDEKFYIPENVYLIGTMNDIDRSVDTFDFAMRRRFRFIELKADENVEMLDDLKKLKNEAKARMENLNRAIEETDGLSRNYQIGAAYFLKLKDLASNLEDTSEAPEAFETLWDDYLEPLLHDYIQGMPDEEETMNRFKKAYGDEGDLNGTDQNQG